MNKPNYILAGLLLIIFALIAYIIFSAPIPEVTPFDETSLREQIRLKDSSATYWEADAISWHLIATDEQSRADSLAKLKSKIIKYYEDQYNFNSTATDLQLDSVIRANW